MLQTFFSWIRKNLLTVACIALCVAVLYALVASHFVYLEMQSALRRANRIAEALTESLWRYGKIESVDTTSDTIVISVEHRFSRNSGFIKMRAHIDKDSIIAKQELIGSQSAYTGLTRPEQSSIDALKPGDNVALLLENNPEQGLIRARVVLFGNPL